MNANIQILLIILTIQLNIPVEKYLAFRLFKWFENNHMKVNPGKSHILLSNKQTEKLKINDVLLKSRAEEKLLGITLDPEFTNTHYKHL